MAIATQYKRGDRVKVFYHPLTERDFEGEAVLVEYVTEVGVYEGRGVHMWRVRFEGETESYYRQIVEPEKSNDRLPSALREADLA